MRYVLAGLLVGLVMVPLVNAADPILAGNWKISILEDGQVLTFWIVKLESEKGKLTGQAVALKRVPPTTIEDIHLQGDLLLFTLNLKNQVRFAFEGKLPQAGGKKIFGSLSRGGPMIPAVLEATQAANQFELDQELVSRTPNDPRVFGAVLDLVKNAKGEKAAAKDLQEWVETAIRASENYGPRWQNDMSLRLLETLAQDHGELAVKVGKQLEASLDPKAPAITQIRLLNVLSSALKKTGQDAQARQIEARVDKLENVAYADYQKTALEFPLEKFAGRKSKSNRAVLVELFTGSQCPPCVAADLAFDALEKTYPTSEVVLLQYHLHVPGPDPLTNPDTEARQEYYGSTVRGTPCILFNGKASAPGGGGKEDAQDKYKEYGRVIDPLLEKETTVNLTAKVSIKGDKLQIKAQTQTTETPGEKVNLRLVLVEDWVRYKGPNGMTYHHRVVRAFPGGSKGTPVTKKDQEITAEVNLDELRSNLDRYLNTFGKEESFPDSQRPLRLRNLHLVAFVQNDANGEILQAVDVPVPEE